MASVRKNIGYRSEASQFFKGLTITKTFKTDRIYENTFGLKFPCVSARIILGVSLHSFFHRKDYCG